jgi:hypothetical protein
MGVISAKGPNPRVTDPLDPRYTDLSNFNKRFDMANLIGEGDVFAGAGYSKIESGSKFGTTVRDIKINDHVVIGNRTGRILEVFSVGDQVVGVTVYEDMRYLPKDYRLNPEAYGYNADGRGRTITYCLRNDLDISETDLLWNGAKVNLYQGSMMILPSTTSNPKTWSKIQQVVSDISNVENEIYYTTLKSRTGSSPEETNFYGVSTLQADILFSNGVENSLVLIYGSTNKTVTKVQTLIRQIPNGGALVTEFDNSGYDGVSGRKIKFDYYLNDVLTSLPFDVKFDLIVDFE